MDIKDELDEMLASLQNTASAAPKSKPTPKTNKNTEDMSVEELINVLSASAPKPKTQPKPTRNLSSTGNIPSELLNILDTQSNKKTQTSQFTAVKEQPVEKKPVQKVVFEEEFINNKPQPVPQPSFIEPERPIVSEPQPAPQTVFNPQPQPVSEQPTVQHTVDEPVSHTPNKVIFEEEIISNSMLSSKPEIEDNSDDDDDSDFSALPKLKKKKHKKIVINHDLPDYEALRQESTDSIKKESEQKHINVPEQKSEDISPADEISHFIEDSVEEAAFDEPEAVEKASEESADKTEIDEPIEEDKKVGLFSKLKNAVNKKTNPDDDEADDELSEQSEEENLSENNDFSDFTPEQLEALPTDELINAVLGDDNGITAPDEENTEEITEESADTDEIISESDDPSEPDGDISPVADETAEKAEEFTEAEEEITEKEINIDVEPPKPKGRLTSFLENVLNESPEDILNSHTEQTVDSEIDISISGKKKFKKHFYSFLGILLFAFAVIGFTFSVGEGIKYIRRFTAGEDKKAEYIDTIYPTVVMNIEAFANPSELSSEQIISAAAWSFIMSDDIENYEHTLDMVSVPAVDIEKYAANLFGSSISAIEHQTVGSGDVKFYYNAETKSYNIPVNPIMFSYKPNITAVSKNGDIHTVEVEYVQETPSWMSNTTKYTKVISKIMKYKLQKKGDGYVINSVEVISINAVN